MFRCVECGKKYEITPEFCDCGNDIFEEINDSKLEEIENVISMQNKIPQIKNKTLKLERITPFEEQYPGLASLKKSFDPISFLIFIICLIVSGFIFASIENTNISEQKVAKQTQDVSKNIPSVESFWNDTAPKIISNKTTEVTEAIPEEKITETKKDKLSEKFEQWLNSPPKVNQDNMTIDSKPVYKTSSVQVKQQQKAVTVVKPQTQSPKIQVQVNQPKLVNSNDKDLIARVQKNTQAVVSQHKLNTNTQPVATTVSAQSFPKIQTKTQQTTVEKPVLRNAQQQPVKTQAQLDQELASYKASLRNTLGKKINFANVVGDGNCAITFKINSAGKLTNRSFTVQSKNITLNDAVYAAMISTPNYSSPPEGYKDEYMTLKVKIYNGNFEITLN